MNTQLKVIVLIISIRNFSTESCIIFENRTSQRTTQSRIIISWCMQI